MVRSPAHGDKAAMGQGGRARGWREARTASPGWKQRPSIHGYGRLACSTLLRSPQDVRGPGRSVFPLYSASILLPSVSHSHASSPGKESRFSTFRSSDASHSEKVSPWEASGLPQAPAQHYCPLGTVLGIVDAQHTGKVSLMLI